MSHLGHRIATAFSKKGVIAGCLNFLGVAQSSNGTTDGKVIGQPSSTWISCTNRQCLSQHKREMGFVFDVHSPDTVPLMFSV